MTVDFKDGRVAQLRQGYLKPIHLTTQFKITENTCTGRENIQGKLLTALQFNFMGLSWTEHPTPEKKGKEVILKETGNGQVLTVDSNFLTFSNRKLFPIAAKDLPNDFFEISDLSWYPSQDTNSLKFVRWDVEAMVTNPETGLSENRTVGLAMDVLYQKIGENRFQLANITHDIGSTFSFFSGDIWSLILKKEDEFCQISIKANLADTVNQVTAYFGNPFTVAPYVFGSDEYSKPETMPATFKKFYENPSLFQAE